MEEIQKDLISQPVSNWLNEPFGGGDAVKVESNWYLPRVFMTAAN